MFAECTSCHGPQPLTVNGGPHGMPPLGQAWVNAHGDAVGEGNSAHCRTCHGADYRGTPLSRAKADRLLNTEFGTKYFWRGFQVGCYTCHQGQRGAHRRAVSAMVDPPAPSALRRAGVR